MGPGIVAAAAIAIVILMVGGAIVPALAVAVLLAVIAYCRWWLYGRLICLGKEVCALGWVITVETPDKKSGLDKFDTDYSVNLCLAPFNLGATQAQVEVEPVQGWLVKETDAIKNSVHPTLDFAGLTAKLYQNQVDTTSFHAEFEGGGVYDLYLACLAALPFAGAAAAVCSIPVFGWIACAILGAIAAILVLVGIIAGLNDYGSPSDVDPSLGNEIHQNDPTGRGADILFVRGEWVYDSAHEGWNECHPIRHCQRVGTWNGSWEMTADAVTAWCDAVSRANDPGTVTNQQQPENQWQIHPVIDGCTPQRDANPPR
jgi:hypothetical protein